MGQTLSSPATEKTSETGGDARFAYSLSEMQGWRITMEDAHAIELKLDNDKEDSNAFFAVYDGHGGGTVAKYAGTHVHKRLLKEQAYDSKNYELALKNAFLGTDEDIRADPAHVRDPSGCTAVAALVTHDGKIYVANAGDSRSVISVKGEVKPLSYDHKPSSETEKARITAAGGYIEYGRVNGNLALSRALGDFEFKKNLSVSAEKQVITADPDVLVHEITDEDEFLILACDGIWDCLSNQQVVDFVRYKVSQQEPLEQIGEAMMEHCLAPDTTGGAGIGCDNMTVMIIALLHGRTKEQWYEWVTDRVNKKHGYETPSEVPALYAQSRLMSFRVRREAQERRDKEREEARQARGDSVSGAVPAGFARVLGSMGGISFHPGGGVSNDGLMFGSDDSDDDSGDEMDTESKSSLFQSAINGRADSPDATEALKAKLDEFEKDIKKDEDGDSNMEIAEESKDKPTPSLQGEAPPPPKEPEPTADAPVEQHKSLPDGDEASPAVQADGLMDTSESPLKA